MTQQEKYCKFYELTREKLEMKAANKYIPNLEQYYTCTDPHLVFYNDLTDEISCVFAQMLFHVQNATMISNIVKFNENYNFLKEITCNFNPSELLDRYSGTEDIVEALRWNDNTQKGLKWNSEKSRSKDEVAIRFASAMIKCAEYLKDFDTKDLVLQDLWSLGKPVSFDGFVTPPDTKKLILYFRSKITSGFSVALTCDFLKEFDEKFSFLPKPDTHIKNVIAALTGKALDYYHTEKREYELIDEVQRITEIINDGLRSNEKEPITVYQLDRMIWLVCTGNFFLTSDDFGKNAYLKAVECIESV